MVLTVTAPLWADIGDREARKLGTVYGINWADGETKHLPIAGNDGVCVSPKPWWSHDAYGEILGYDDFEGTLQWRQLTGTVTKASDAGFVLQGTSALKLVTAAQAGMTASASQCFSPLCMLWQYSAVEFWFALSAVADVTPQDFMMFWFVQDGTTATQQKFGIRYWNYQAGAAQKKWQFWNSAGAWQDVEAGSYRRPLITTPQFNYVLLTLDSQRTGSYRYKFLQMMDVGGIFIDDTPEVIAYDRASSMVNFYVTTDVAAASTAYVGAFILHNGVYNPSG